MTVKSRTFALNLVVSTFALAAITAHAQGSFLLQLGTFGTRDDATQKWEQLKAANGDIVGRLQGHIAEVMLPPDNIPTYRTQAGPVETRKDAKALCAALMERNVECYVVETAFAATDLVPEMTVDNTSNAQSPLTVATADVPPHSEIAAVPDAAPAAPSNVMYKAMAPQDIISTSDVTPVQAAQPEVPAAASSTASAAPAVMPDTVIVEGTPTPVTAPVVAASAPAPAVVQMPKEDEGKPQDDEPGFFGRMFSSDEGSKAPESLEPKKTEIKTASSKYSNPNLVKKSGYFRGTFRFNDKDVLSDEKPVETKTAATSEDEKPGFFGRMFGAEEEKKETPAPAVATDAATQAPAPVTIKGDVQVAEAIRVPVSTYNDKSAVKYELVDASAQGESGTYYVQVSYFNNEAGAYKFFKDMKDASAGALDDVRIRITRPFATDRQRASLRIGPVAAGNMNAICREAQARTLRCTSILNTASEVQTAQAEQPAKRKRYPSPLEAVDIPAYRNKATPPVAALTAAPVDTPAAIAPSSAPAATSSVETVSTYVPASTGVSDTGLGGQWIDLGGFESAQAALGHWRGLQQNQPSLQNLKTSIAGALGGAEGQKFQLKAGPFVSGADAENACKAIVNSGNSCSLAKAQ